MSSRYQQLEQAILALVLKHGDHQGYAVTLGSLTEVVRERVAEGFPNLGPADLIDTLKRLEPRYITLWKYSEAHSRLLQYSRGEIEDDYSFTDGDFRIRRTPNTGPRAEELALEDGHSRVSLPPTSESISRDTQARSRDVNLLAESRCRCSRIVSTLY